ncbi:Elongation of very long chain fatty acids protein 4 [Chamberlinius hualienensis]
MNLFYLWDSYNYYWTFRDRNVDGFLLMSSVIPTVFLICFCFAGLSFGLKYMKNRPPFSMVRIVAFYNIIIVVLNLYCASQIFLGAYRKRYDWICEPNHYEAIDDDEMRIIRAFHLAYLCKFLEMVDVFYLIAKKKSAQSCWIILYHHSLMLILYWYCVRWIPAGPVFGQVTINSIAHAVIYGYFGFVIFFPEYSQSPVIKRMFVTFLIVQSVLYGVYAFKVAYVQCAWTIKATYIFIGYLFSIVIFHCITFICEYCRGNKLTIASYAFKTMND